MKLYRPKLRETVEPFASMLFGSGIVRSNALEALIIAGFVRGLSVRDVEAALTEALGPQATVSKSSVSRICQVIRTEFEAWRTRNLSSVELVYLFADASMFKMHPGAKGEPVLAAWGITMEGKPVFLALQADSGESTDGWADCLEDLKRRGLRAPLLGISDGAGGLINALELVFKRSGRQRCLVHRARNILAKVPKHAQDGIKAAFWAIFDDIEEPEGDAAVAEARRRAGEFRLRYDTLYPSAVRCLFDDFDALCAHLRFPREHWKRIRHSNFIERTFGESRRRVKVIGRFPGEESCLSLVWPCLIVRHLSKITIMGPLEPRLARCAYDTRDRSPARRDAPRDVRTTTQEGGGQEAGRDGGVRWGTRNPCPLAFTPSVGRYPPDYPSRFTFLLGCSRLPWAPDCEEG